MFTVLLCVLAHRKGFFRPKWNGAICVLCASPTKTSKDVCFVKNVYTRGPEAAAVMWDSDINHFIIYILLLMWHVQIYDVKNFSCCSGVSQFIWTRWLSRVFLWACSMYHEGLFMDISHSRHLDSSTQVHVNMMNGLNSIQVGHFQEPGVVHSGLLGHVNGTEPSLMLLIARSWLLLWSTLWLQRNSNSALRSHTFLKFFIIVCCSICLHSVTQQHFLKSLNSQAPAILNVPYLTVQEEKISCFITLFFASVVL